jgi:hypothetical protein
MSLTTTITGLGSVTASATYSVKYDEKSESYSVDEDKRNHVLATTIASTATVAGASIANQHNINEIYEKYSSAYVDSLSDEELASALEQVNLLSKELDENTNTKTI